MSRLSFSMSAEVAKLVDALRSGRSGVYPRVGSSPSFGTNYKGHSSNKIADSSHAMNRCFEWVLAKVLD